MDMQLVINKFRCQAGERVAPRQARGTWPYMCTCMATMCAVWYDGVQYGGVAFGTQQVSQRSVGGEGVPRRSLHIIY